MFQDFAKRKFDEYISLVEFTAGRVSFGRIRTSALPAFILNFFEFYISDKNTPIDKKDFEEILNKAIVFNINYIIKPKNTILKFLFSDLETRPVELVLNRLKYFQFYGYYTEQISGFISINSLEVVSSNQIAQLVDGINQKILEEISYAQAAPQRMNMVKLLYYFFHDLGENNPINLKLPKKILSAYFHDKGFNDIKNRVDNFFSDEIFIQETVELMNPHTKKHSSRKTDVGFSEKEVKDIVSRAKTELITKEQSVKEVEKILHQDEALPDELLSLNIKVIRDQEKEIPEANKPDLITGDEIYSDDLIFASQLKDIAPSMQPSAEEKKDSLIKDLFCEQTYRRKIIKRLFGKNETSFRESVGEILSKQEWDEAVPLIENLFSKNRVDYLSEEAVKFVDIMQSHFRRHTPENKAV
jgi:hypothetical protein